MKPVTDSCLPYLTEETKEEKPAKNGVKQFITINFNQIFPILMDDLVDHAEENGVPKDTLDWYENVGSSIYLL